jgi:hypothetical protein
VNGVLGAFQECDAARDVIALIGIEGQHGMSSCNAKGGMKQIGEKNWEIL